MDNIEKGLGILMWVTVALLVIISFAVIMIGHATNFDFFYGFQDVNVLELGETLVSTISTNNVI